MALYTRTGDDGTTGLFSDHRTSKADPRLAVMGSVDELNSVLGLAMSLYPPAPGRVIQRLKTTQQQLFRLGCELADPLGESGVRLAPSTIKTLEQAIDSFDMRLPNLTGFILPGGCAAGSALHQARAICRRAERELVVFNESLPPDQQLRPTLVGYLNRLSDLLFAMARFTNMELDMPERKINLR